MYIDAVSRLIWVPKIQAKGSKNDIGAAKHLATLHKSPLIKTFLEFYTHRKIPYQVPYPIGDAEASLQEQKQEQKQKPDNTGPTTLSGKLLPEPRKATMPQPKLAKADTEFADEPFTQEFLAFYAAYPKKKVRADAYKAWKATAKTRPAIDEILKALEAQGASFDWTKDGGRFVPHPATWLRGSRWSDEVKSNENQKPVRLNHFLQPALEALSRHRQTPGATETPSRCEHMNSAQMIDATGTFGPDIPHKYRHLLEEFSPKVQKAVEPFLARQQQQLVVVGPTGTGKSSLLADGPAPAAASAPKGFSLTCQGSRCGFGRLAHVPRDTLSLFR